MKRLRTKEGNWDTGGSIYIASMKGFRGRVKIGMTAGDPYERVAELSKDTGVPEPLTLEYYATVDGDPQPIETAVHRALESKRRKGEWFQTGLETAIRNIREIAADQIRDEYERKYAGAEAERPESIFEQRFEKIKKVKNKRVDYMTVAEAEDFLARARAKEKAWKAAGTLGKSVNIPVAPNEKLTVAEKSQLLLMEHEKLRLREIEKAQQKSQEWAVQKVVEEREEEDSYYINKTWRRRIGKIVGYTFIVFVVLLLLDSVTK